MTTADCAETPGRLRPLIDLSRCEGKRACAEVCPYDVFVIGKIKPADFSALGFFGKLKSRAHGGTVAHVARPESCHACGLCVTACPEQAIRLERV